MKALDKLFFNPEDFDKEHGKEIADRLKDPSVEKRLPFSRSSRLRRLFAKAKAKRDANNNNLPK